nr:uncharacterized protein DDB_G0281497-like isoform X1 [Onthophagus taurus]
MKFTITAFTTLVCFSMVYGRHITKHHKTHDDRNKHHLKRDGGDLTTTDNTNPNSDGFSNINVESTTSYNSKRHAKHLNFKKNHLKRDGDLTPGTEDPITPITELDNNPSGSPPGSDSSTSSQPFKRHGTHQRQKNHHAKRDGAEPYTELSSTEQPTSNDFPSVEITTQQQNPSKRHRNHHQKKHHLKRDGGDLTTTDNTNPNSDGFSNINAESTTSYNSKRHAKHRNFKKNHLKRDGDFTSGTEDPITPITELDNNPSGSPPSSDSSTSSQPFKRHGTHQRQKNHHAKRDGADPNPYTGLPSTEQPTFNDFPSVETTTQQQNPSKRHRNHHQKKHHLKRDGGDGSSIIEVSDPETSSYFSPENSNPTTESSIVIV